MKINLKYPMKGPLSENIAKALGCSSVYVNQIKNGKSKGVRQTRLYQNVIDVFTDIDKVLVKHSKKNKNT